MRRGRPVEAQRGAEEQEIERTYLLSRMPELPPDARSVRIEQGYLPDTAPAEGRLRREQMPDGTIRFTHTIKRGDGLVRSESERLLDESEFNALWPLTEGRRLRKRRWVVPAGELVWEIDEYDDLDLVLAEVELPDAEAAAPPPPWLAPFIVRDVTEEPEYRNWEIALRIAKGRGRRGSG